MPKCPEEPEDPLLKKRAIFGLVLHRHRYTKYLNENLSDLLNFLYLLVCHRYNSLANKVSKFLISADTLCEDCIVSDSLEYT